MLDKAREAAATERTRRDAAATGRIQDSVRRIGGSTGFFQSCKKVFQSTLARIPERDTGELGDMRNARIT